MPAAPRTEGNYRTYSPEHRRRLHFIRRCRDLGFTLDQVRDLLRLSSDKTTACAEVDRIAAQHRRSVEEKLADLTKLANELRRLSACCRGKGLIANCRIIEALSP
jgi:DNA-binding transcriptional MerR regulator